MEVARIHFGPQELEARYALLGRVVRILFVLLEAGAEVRHPLLEEEVEVHSVGEVLLKEALPVLLAEGGVVHCGRLELEVKFRTEVEWVKVRAMKLELEVKSLYVPLHSMEVEVTAPFVLQEAEEGENRMPMRTDDHLGVDHHREEGVTVPDVPERRETKVQEEGEDPDGLLELEEELDLWDKHAELFSRDKNLWKSFILQAHSADLTFYLRASLKG